MAVPVAMVPVVAAEIVAAVENLSELDAADCATAKNAAASISTVRTFALSREHPRARLAQNLRR